MAYGMQQLRKAGQAIKDFDAAYAARASRDMGGEELAPTRTTLGGQPLFGQQSYTTRAERNADAQQVRGRDANMLEHLVGDIGERVMVGGMIGTNAGYRYGLPAAGLTLAGKGLYDLTAQFGNAADYQEPGQLSL